MTDGLKVFMNWDKRSAVRTSPRRILSDQPEYHYFSPNLAPVLGDSSIQQLPKDQLKKIEVQFLYNYLRFTEYLEISLVNTVILSIINNELPITFDSKIRDEAFKIYCDEAYHALQSHDILGQLEDASGEKPLALEIPLKLRLENLRSSFPSVTLPWFELFFVCVAETLVSQELREHIKDETIHPGIQDIMKDHAKDESSHAIFFKEVMVALKTNLTDDDYQVFKKYVPLFLEAYLIPDRNNLNTIFEPYLPGEVSTKLLDEYLQKSSMEAFISKSSTFLQRTLVEIEK